MNKEQQIEEMAKFMHYKAHGKDKDCDNEKCEMCWCSCKNDAEALYNAGYRKIDKDSVVLSREEYEQLKQTIISQSEESTKLCTHLTQKIIDTRKETVEKILKDFKLQAREYQNEDIIIDDNGERLMTNNEKLNYLYTYLCDKYKVEIKEQGYGK